MASSELMASLRFLTDAGHLLATTAPETSAYLMSRRNNLMFEHEMPLSDKQRQHVCTCCGHIMLLGQASELYVRPGERKTTRKRRSKRATKGKGGEALRLPRSSGPTKAISCGHCGRVTEVKLPTPAPIPRRKAVVNLEKLAKRSVPGASSSLSNTPHEMPSQKPSASASSKKRAKSRKAGLQALLNQSNASKPGLGLSLADFMAK
ncbi:hypothetical protein VTI74DRAFT_6273 [Chaetomium olivicolor]